MIFAEKNHQILLQVLFSIVISQIFLICSIFSPALNMNQGILNFPVIEKFQYIMTILLFAMVNNYSRLKNNYIIFYQIIFFTLIGFAIISGIFWRLFGSYNFNLSTLDISWELLAMIIVLIHMGLIINDQRKSWRIETLLFTIMLIGVMGHFFINTNTYYSGPMRASQFIVFAILPIYLNTIFQSEKGDSFNPSGLPILQEKLEPRSLNDNSKDVETELSLIWMELVGYSPEINRIPLLLRAISISFHQDFVLFFKIQEPSNQMVFQTGFDNGKKITISSDNIKIPDDADFKYIFTESEVRVISASNPDYYLIFDKFQTFLDDDQISQMVVLPLKQEKNIFGFLLFITSFNKKLWDSGNTYFYSKIADLSANIILTFQKHDQPVKESLSKEIEPENTFVGYPANSDIEKINIETPEQDDNKVNQSTLLQAINEREQITLIVQELRQPLSSILGYTDLILSESSGVIGAMQQKFLMKIKDGNEKMRTLLDELIQVTSFGELQSNFNFEAISIEELIDKAIYFNHDLLLIKNIALRLNFEKQIPQLTIDREAIQLVLNNLINSAINSSFEGGEINIKLIIKASELDEKYLLTIIRNSGNVLNETQINDVFSQKQLNDIAISRFTNDPQVNLAFTKTMVEALGGRIWIETGKGNMNQFSFLLPFQNQVRQN